ncbi:hypothetical protein PR048_026650 [Dryococelus australis]|uniref:Reverse transcriptase domain-containing protein n=1 Tax=Dryococelus australis TaxID=614101 RepID=A0ABQ9GLX7_9NEOP|nr:hypothetical protein PR048_026650 [Dryococelus australis]
MGVEKPMTEEVKNSIRSMKRRKAPEIHGINAEILQEVIPEEWKELVICPIFKKGVSTMCTNYRGISLLCVAYKVLSLILLRRLTPYMEETEGFRKNKSTVDQMHVLQRITEKYLEYNKEVHC